MSGDWRVGFDAEIVIKKKQIAWAGMTAGSHIGVEG